MVRYDLAMTRCLFMGSKKMGLNIFRNLITKSPYDWEIWHPNDFNDPRSNFNEWLVFANENQIKIDVLENNKEFEDLISINDFELALVCGWYWKINLNSLNKTKYGFWGIHNSLLPKYRGGSPLIWSLLSNDPKIGSSVFKLEEGMDTGPIALQIVIENDSTSVEDVYSRIEDCYTENLSFVLEQILSNKCNLVYQDHEVATYFKSRNASHSEINFAWTPEYLHKFVRVIQYPYPQAFFKINESKYYIRNFETKELEINAKVGEVIDVQQNRFFIKGIDNYVHIIDALSE
jgi:methionyl-tRNA formyltransferase